MTTTQNTTPRHAVFARLADGISSPVVRVSGYVDWTTAQDLWEALDNRRRAGELPHLRYLEVRSSDDPKYKGLDYEPTMALPAEERPQWVKLSRSERAALLMIGRNEYDLDAASDAMFSALVSDLRWAHLAAVDISDYAHAAARFCFPQEAKTW